MHLSPRLSRRLRTGLTYLIFAFIAANGLAQAARAQCGPATPGDIWAAQLPLLSGTGDWSIGRVGPAPRNLEIVNETDGQITLGCNGGTLDPSQGVLAATIMENRDVITESGEVAGEAVLSMWRMGENEVDSSAVAAAYFPYSAGWIAGRFDASGVYLEGNPAPGDPDAPVISPIGTGHYEITIPGVSNSYTDGMLYVIVDGTGENFASARAMDPANGSPGTGTWRVRAYDNQAAVGVQDRGIRFVYLPYDLPGAIAGRVEGATGTPLVQIGDWTSIRIGEGRYRLDLADGSPESGMLLLGTGNTFSNPDDNILRYETDGSGRFEVVNRDQDGSSITTLDNNEFVFTFIPFPAHVVDERKLASTNAGGPFSDLTSSGISIAALGDIDDDGVPDQAVGSRALAGEEGELYVLRMNADGTVKASTRIKSGEGGFTGALTAADDFAVSVTAIGDLDRDGRIDVAVGAAGSDAARGAVWILFLNADGTVRDQQQIANGIGGFPGTLAADTRLGSGLAGIGDLDGDRIPDLAVGAAGDVPDPGSSAGQGTIWVLFLNRDGTVRDGQQIGDGIGGFAGSLGTSDEFGTSLAAIGDVNGDGTPDVAVGAPGDSPDNGALRDAGAVWVLGLDSDGTVVSESRISRIDTDFELFAQLDNFGRSVTALGDLNGDGTQDLAIGADRAGASGFSTGPGQVFVTYLASDQSVLAMQRLGERAGGFEGEGLESSDAFGASVAAIGDLDGDGVTELSVGEPDDEGVLGEEGAAWTLFLSGAPAICGDAVLDPTEICDDGNAFGGDGCAATCTLEDILGIQGTAQGGTLTVFVDGTAVAIDTLPGQTALTVSLVLANAISIEPVLAANLIYGIPQPGVGESSVLTNGLFGGFSNTDPGLTIVPEPGIGSMAIAGIGLLSMLARRRRA